LRPIIKPSPISGQLIYVDGKQQQF